ncbi:RCC1 domain-containing protein [Oerskovia sp. NPDC056781]|uniref:RCC1 domain-containing protein n=1 Tax=Oerskovia sp. NPDC056781 TaxID=3345942 RepID=UPI00366EE38E
MTSRTTPRARSGGPGSGRLRPRAAAVLVLLFAASVVLWGAGRAQPTVAAWTDAVYSQGLVDVATASTATDVVAGEDFSCALADGQVWCTGDNSAGQLGTGDTTSSDVFVGPVGGELQGRTVTHLDAGAAHACAATDDGVFCWGRNDHGQVGQPGVTGSTVPVRVASQDVRSVTGLELRADSSCVVSGGKGYCWGDTHTSAGSSAAPVLISGGALPASAVVTDIGVGEASACLTADGVPYCWGENGRGQLGDGTTKAALVPVQVVTTGAMAGFAVGDVAVGQNFACAVGSGPNNALRTFCWGDNAKKQLGQSNDGAQVELSSMPLQVRGALTEIGVRSIDLGGMTACAITAAADGYCWGDNASGQAGVGYDESWAQTVVDRPSEITTGQMDSKQFATIDVDSNHACGMSVAGNVYCWGSNAQGQLGIEGGPAAAPKKYRPWPVVQTWSAWG